MASGIVTAGLKFRRAAKGVIKTGKTPGRRSGVPGIGAKATMGQKAVARGGSAVLSGRKQVNKLGNKAINVGKKLGMSDATTKNLRKHSGKIGAGIVAGGALGVAGAVGARNKAKEDKKFKNRAKKFLGM